MVQGGGCVAVGDGDDAIVRHACGVGLRLVRLASEGAAASGSHVGRNGGAGVDRGVGGVVRAALLRGGVSAGSSRVFAQEAANLKHEGKDNGIACNRLR